MKNEPLKKSVPTVKPRARAERVQTKLPITLGKHTGQVQDISATGVYFEIEAEQKPGSKVSFMIDLQTPGGPLQVHCSGEVVRVKQNDGKFGIAVKITDSQLK